MIREWRVAVLAVVTAVLLGACGGAGGGSGGATGATGDPVRGGAATVLTLSEPRTLDPAVSSNNGPGGGVIGNALFGTLLVTDPASGEIRPSLAQSFATTDGGRTFDLVLRDRLTFSDGSPFGADAIKAHWDRMKDPATSSTYRGDASQVAATQVVSPTTLRVSMVSPVPNFAYSVVTTTMNWIPKPEAIGAGPQAFDAKPIGAGPFTLQEWRRQDAMVVVRNPSFWDAPRPYLDRITFRTALDASQRVNTVISGGADVAVESSWSNLAKAEQSSVPVDVQPLSGGNYLALNVRRAPFDDPRARAAVAAALDPTALNASVYNGRAELVDTVFRPGSPWHTGTAVAPPDPALAQRLFDELAAAGKPVRFTFIGTSGSESKATGEAIQAQLRAFRNVTVEVRTAEYAQIAALQGTHDFEATVSSAAFIDPEPRLWTAFSGTSRANMSGIADPQLDQALDRGRTATSTEERRAAYAAVGQRLADQHPGVWLVRNASAVISARDVGGIEQYGLGSLRPDTLWVRP